MAQWLRHLTCNQKATVLYSQHLLLWHLTQVTGQRHTTEKNTSLHELTIIVTFTRKCSDYLTCWTRVTDQVDCCYPEQNGIQDRQGADHSHSNVSQRAGTDPCTTSGSALFWCSDARHSSHTYRTGPSRFSVAAPSTCNSLPADIRLCENILTFKRHLKTHLYFKLT